MSNFEADTFKEKRYVSFSCYDILDLFHFGSSSTGDLLTVDRVTGSIMWTVRFKSPVVSVYRLLPTGLTAVPYTSVSADTLSHLSYKFSAETLEERMDAKNTMLL